MQLSMNGKEIGQIYFNIQLDKEHFASISVLKEQLNNGSFKVSIGAASFIVKSFRKVYFTEHKIYIEGAELQF